MFDSSDESDSSEESDSSGESDSSEESDSADKSKTGYKSKIPRSTNTVAGIKKSYILIYITAAMIILKGNNLLKY